MADIEAILTLFDWDVSMALSSIRVAIDITQIDYAQHNNQLKLKSHIRQQNITTLTPNLCLLDQCVLRKRPRVVGHHAQIARCPFVSAQNDGRK